VLYPVVEGKIEWLRCAGCRWWTGNCTGAVDWWTGRCNGDDDIPGVTAMLWTLSTAHWTGLLYHY